MTKHLDELVKRQLKKQRKIKLKNERKLECEQSNEQEQLSEEITTNEIEECSDDEQSKTKSKLIKILKSSM